MKIRCIPFLLLFFILLFPLHAQGTLSKLYVKEVVYKGTDKQIGNTISAAVKEEFRFSGMFDIVDTESSAGYVLSCTIEEKDDALELFMEIQGTAENKIKETVVKKDKKEKGVYILLHEVAVYLHRKLFPLDVYLRENEAFFTAKTTKNDEKKDIIDRNRKISGDFIQIRSPDFFEPLNEELFQKHRFQLFPSCEVSFPLNLLDDDVSITPYVHLPLNFYIITTKIIMVSIIAEGTYFPLRKEISSDTFNTLQILGVGAGVGVVYPLPFYNAGGLRLNLCGGSTMSFLFSDQNTERMSLSFDLYFHPSFEFEQAITKNISLSLKCSYMWIFYMNEYLHLMQTGVGFGYRF